MTHPRRTPARVRSADFLAGGGAMGELIRSADWAKTPLGPVDTWPQSLRTSVSILLASGFPMYIAWGPSFTQLYNDAYRPILGSTKHPGALGQSTRETFSEIWDFIGPMFDRVMRDGEATTREDQMLPLDRNGFVEECYFIFSYSAIRDETGGVGGVLVTVTETTKRVYGERRLRTLRELGASAAQAKTAEAACTAAADILAQNRFDVPFALIYLLDDSGSVAHLRGAVGLPPGVPASPIRIDLAESTSWPLGSLAPSSESEHVVGLERRFGPLPGGPWPESPHQALILPVLGARQDQITGFLVAGISPRQMLDEEYRGFLHLAAGHLSTAIANAHAHEAERERAESLAELDRAKTAFFSNVSHEFRTPLTLQLGPLTDLLQDSEHELPPSQRERVAVAHRNSLRLLKLVNTLLDFSRIEVGRMEASYEPTDLAALTTELASSFESAATLGGIGLVVDCPPLPEPIYVDRQMWEKIVLNLASNAFKFTLHGEIRVALRWEEGGARLRVSDTGSGIAEADLPRIFERFYRARHATGRTQEGSGIGLSLVQELIRLHGGTISVASELGRGSTFEVMIPAGSSHLPADQIGASRELTSTTAGVAPFVAEVMLWLPGATVERSEPILPLVAPSARIIVADDNADMRQYITRLLSEHWTVVPVMDGLAALEQAKREPADLIISDVMMPGLDGFGLLRELRADPRTRAIPVIMLSARAGEESRVEGLDAGADDYLVKPFSARTLVARVGATLAMARVRRESEAAVRASEERYRAYIEQTSEAVWRCEVREPIPINLSENEQIDRIYAGGVLAECNDTMARQYGFEKASELVGAELKDLMPRSDLANVEYLRAFIRAGYRLSDAESHEVDREGQSRYFLNNLLGIIEDGRLIRAWGSQRDVTKQKQAEQELRESEARFRAMADTAPVMIWISDADNMLTWFNRPWLEFTGRRLEDELGEGWLKGVHPDDLERVRRIDAAAFIAQRPLVMEYRLRRSDGSYRWVLDNGVPRYHPDSTFAGYIGSCIDITDRKAGEIALLASEDRYRSLAQASASIIWTTDAEGRFSAASPSWEAFTGQRWPEYRDAGRAEAIHPDDRERLAREWAGFLAAKQPCETRYRLRRHDRVYRHVHTRAVPILEHDGKVREWVGTVTDVEDQMIKEERLRLAERMETVGRLAGGIAHEANNQMSVVLGASHFVLRRDDIPHQVREDVEEIQRAAERTAGITQQLLAFSRRQMLQSKVLDLNALVEQARPLLQRTLGEQSLVSLQLAPTLGLVRADPGQLEQVLLNLALNARDAMPRGGTLTIETADVVLTEEYAVAKAVATIQPGPHVLLAVSDTGVGMDRETLGRVFEPFFTTKEVGAGTGLGLATIYGIVKQSGGFIWAYSEVGSGSTFKVYLPAVSAELTTAVEAAPLPTARQGERILVAEDDAAVRSVVGRTLRELGYDVSEVSDGLDALAGIDPAAPPDLVITDVVMPRLSGRGLAASLAQRWPSLPVLFMSGYTGYDVVTRGLLDQEQPFVQRPVVPEILARKVRQLLDAALSP